MANLVGSPWEPQCRRYQWRQVPPRVRPPRGWHRSAPGAVVPVRWECWASARKSGGSRSGLMAPGPLPHDLNEDEEDDW